MKKILGLISIIVFVFVLTACDEAEIEVVFEEENAGLVGTWLSITDWATMSESDTIWTFNEDGSGLESIIPWHDETDLKTWVIEWQNIEDELFITYVEAGYEGTPFPALTFQLEEDSLTISEGYHMFIGDWVRIMDWDHGVE